MALSMWRSYAIGTMEQATLTALIQLICDFADREHRRPTAEEISVLARSVKGS